MAPAHLSNAEVLRLPRPEIMPVGRHSDIKWMAPECTDGSCPAKSEPDPLGSRELARSRHNQMFARSEDLQWPPQH